MSFLKKALGTIVEFEETPTPSQDTPSTQPQPTSTVVQAQSSVNQEMLDVLKKIVEARKTPFTALNEMIERLKAVPMDDATRLQAAIASITADGSRNVDSIIKSIDLHLRDIDSEVIRFTNAAEAAVKAKVSSLKSAAQQMRDLIESNKTKIVSLNEQIASLQASITENEQKATEMELQADTEQTTIMKTNQDFTAAADMIKSELNGKRTSLTSTK